MFFGENCVPKVIVMATSKECLFGKVKELMESNNVEELFVVYKDMKESFDSLQEKQVSEKEILDLN